MGVSPDGNTVYVAIFESGNASTIISGPLADLNDFPRPSVLAFPSAPSLGLDPPPNSGTNFFPSINPALTNTAAEDQSHCEEKQLRPLDG